MSTARIEHRKYKSICKEKHKIQPKHKENCNDRMRIYIVSTVGIHKQKHNIPPESRTCIAYKMKKL
jgi:ribosomal protein S30